MFRGALRKSQMALRLPTSIQQQALLSTSSTSSSLINNNNNNNNNNNPIINNNKRQGSFRGALMSKPHSFKSRDWRLSAIQTIDVLGDGMGSSIKVYYKEFEIVKVMPNRNLELNERWISDKVRYFYDGLSSTLRIRSPYIGNKRTTWDETLPKLKSMMNIMGKEYGTSSIAMFTSSQMSCETMFKMNEMSSMLGITNGGMEPTGVKHDYDFLSPYQFNTAIEDLENIDCCVFISTNPRYESSNINLRLRKIFRRGCLDLWSLGFFPAAMFNVNFMDGSFANVKALGEGKHMLCEKLRTAEKPLLMVGDGILNRWDAKGIQSYIASVCKSFSRAPEKGIEYVGDEIQFHWWCYHGDGEYDVEENSRSETNVFHWWD